MKMGEILDLTQEKPFSSWFKLLTENFAKLSHERIVVDDKEVEKVCKLCYTNPYDNVYM